MTHSVPRSILFHTLIALCGMLAPGAVGKAAPLDVRKISELADAPATITADGVVRVTWPRDDVAVKVGGMTVKPAAALTSWAAFAPSAFGAMALGETIVCEDEVDAAIDAAFAAGLHVTALHNRFLRDEPRVYVLGLGGDGPADKLAAGVKNVWAAVKAVRATHPEPPTAVDAKTPRSIRLDAKSIERVVGHKAEAKDGVVKVTISRDAVLRGTKITATMGVASWAAFEGTDRLAAMDGEIALTADEVQPVLRSLRTSRIHITGLRNHMMGEQPTLYFAQFRGNGQAGDLAKAFAAAIKAMKDASRPGRSLK